MVRKQKGGGTLGSALRKDKNKDTIKKSEYIKVHKAENVHEGENKGKRKLISVVERENVDDFLYNAELKQQKFNAIRQRKLITTDGGGAQVVIDLSTGNREGPSETERLAAMKEMEHIRIPRRPAWDGKRTGADQRLLENTVFVDWRRDLAAVEEKYRFAHVTPYEKNIEIWKQLWMVIERSDILVQIVDCRDPLFFRCEDLETYVKEVGVGKVNFLLLNKADLLDNDMRKYWSDYFNSNNIQHIFFSAKDQQQQIDKDIIEGDVPENIDGLVNTPSIVDRTTLKLILKKIVNDFKKGLTVSEAPKKETETATEQTPTQKTEEPAPIPVTESEPKAEPTKTEAPKAPAASKIKILKVVSDADIKDKPVINLYDAIQQKEEAMFAEGGEADDDYSSSEDCGNHEGAEGEMSEKPGKPVPNTVEEDDSEDFETDEEGEEEESEPKEVDIYTKLGVDRRNLVSKPFFDKKDENSVVIGMIGFPNVGKSSVINVLCNKKLVGVGARPGKTKNFQTIVLEQNLMLCDCPGLVFPSIVHSKAHMVCNSVIPIDNVKDYMAPTDLIAKRIPARVLEYHLKCPLFCDNEYIEAGRLLHVLARNRGIISGSGQPNYAEAAKIILKKFVNGELVYAALPPSVPTTEASKCHQFNQVPEDYKQTTSHSIRSEIEKERYVDEEKKVENLMEEDFFQMPVDVEGIIENLSQEDVIDLVMGKKVNGIKLDKMQRRELKFAIKRDAETDEIASILSSFLGRGGQTFISLKKKAGQQL